MMDARVRSQVEAFVCAFPLESLRFAAVACFLLGAWLGICLGFLIFMGRG